jgi:hypothetical protein
MLGRFKNLDPIFVGSAYLFLKKKKDIRLRRALWDSNLQAWLILLIQINRTFSSS